jgi:hypothetical protein
MRISGYNRNWEKRRNEFDENKYKFVLISDILSDLPKWDNSRGTNELLLWTCLPYRGWRTDSTVQNIVTSVCNNCLNIKKTLLVNKLVYQNQHNIQYIFKDKIRYMIHVPALPNHRQLFSGESRLTSKKQKKNKEPIKFSFLTKHKHSVNRQK